MGFDVALITVIVSGIALSALYVRAEYRNWREHGATQRRREAALRELHATSLSEQRDALLPSVLKLQGFGESEAANPDNAAEFGAARHAPGRSDSPYALAERRKRVRKRATH
jgi:FtsZ-interacting cell division protein ZipA